MTSVKPLKLGIGIIGPGTIGSTLINQINSQKPILLKKHDFDVNVVGITGSKKMCFNEKGINLEKWKDVYRDTEIKADLDEFFDKIIKAKNGYNGHIFVDNTASDEVANHYDKWIKKGCHIVTPNKRLGSGPINRYKSLFSECNINQSYFFYESTVGAGLPIISSLKGLIDTGDIIDKIEGVFSGTLSFIFNTVSKEKSFSSVVSEAKSRGFTEPDPREDLSGMDVARKVIVLARECGLSIELDDLSIESLVPKELQNINSSDEFMKLLPNYDDDMLAKMVDAENSGEILRYVGIVDITNGKCDVKLKRYPKSHPLSNLNGTDNMIVFKTKRYCDQPLVIQGPGAGPETTAMGIFSDIVTICNYLKRRF